MKFLVIVKATKDSESGRMPTMEEMAPMGKFNEELVKAGVMVTADGLLSSEKGVRVRFEKNGHTITKGPFKNPEDLVAGFWIWKLNSMDEAVDWLKRAPFGPGMEIEIRQIAQAEDFGENRTPEFREYEDRLRKLAEEHA